MNVSVELSRQAKPGRVASSDSEPIVPATSVPHNESPNLHSAVRDWRETMIRRAAYFRSLNRPFEPGKELEDWLAAEQQIDNGEAPPFDPAAIGWREKMIRKAAYFSSLHRRPGPGKELEDWLAAEHEFDDMHARVRSRAKERSRTAYPSRMCCY
jgi:hypothetical protein